MARYFKWAIGFGLLAIGIFSSCQEGGEAGDMLGQWQLAGTDNCYIAFSGSLTNVRHTTNGYLDTQITGNYQRQGDSLFIQYYSENALKSDTVLVEETFGMKPFQNIRVKIETLNGDVLVLSKDGQKWNFSKN
jgi:hypothetical protein